MKTCLIYGQNGLDLDVAFNLRAFYEKLGYWAVFSEKLFDATLLVILRAVDEPLECSVFKFGQIHVYDYGGWGYDGCVKSLDYEKTYIFTTSPKHKEYLVRILDFPENHIYIAFPPVETSLWITSLKKKKYSLVHIGNCKYKVFNDEFQSRFDKVVKTLNVNVWGNNWEFKNIKSRGSAGLFSVSEIYAASRIALGIMVPFQRDVTFSGRFWHAPLNGCYLLSEPGIYTRKIPGVLETTYKEESVCELINNLVGDRVQLRKDALEFWENENTKTKLTVIDILSQSSESVKFSYGLTIYCNVANSFKFLYQVIASRLTKY